MRDGFGDDSFQRELAPILFGRDPKKLYLTDIVPRLKEEESFRIFRNNYAAFCREAMERESAFGVSVPADDFY